MFGKNRHRVLAAPVGRSAVVPVILLNILAPIYVELISDRRLSIANGVPEARVALVWIGVKLYYSG
jgi:hypothetical protein